MLRDKVFRSGVDLYQVGGCFMCWFLLMTSVVICSHPETRNEDVRLGLDDAGAFASWTALL